VFEVIEVFWFGGIGFGFLPNPTWSILGKDCLSDKQNSTYIKC
jgi:hypothetical protein